MATEVSAAVASDFILDRRDAVPALIGRHEDFLIERARGRGRSLKRHPWRPPSYRYAPRRGSAPRRRGSSRRDQQRISDSMLMQLPVPLLCTNRTGRAPPKSAPASSATPSSSVGQCDRMRLRIGERPVDQKPVAGIRHIGELSDIVPAQQVIEFVLPFCWRVVAFVHKGGPLVETSANAINGRPNASRTQPNTGLSLSRQRTRPHRRGRPPRLGDRGCVGRSRPF